VTAAAKTSRDLAAEVAFLTRALKAPTLRESVDRLAERARAESWTHGEYLVACLQREVSARDAHGGEGRIRGSGYRSASGDLVSAAANGPGHHRDCPRDPDHPDGAIIRRNLPAGCQGSAVSPGPSLSISRAARPA
jgi:hypothetical protein